MLQSIKVITLMALMGGAIPTWAQQVSPNSPAQAQTDPISKPAGDATTNTLVPYGVNPPVPDSSTPQPMDTKRPETTSQQVPVPQGNFTAESPNPASPIETTKGD